MQPAAMSTCGPTGNNERPNTPSIHLHEIVRSVVVQHEFHRPCQRKPHQHNMYTQSAQRRAHRHRRTPRPSPPRPPRHPSYSGSRVPGPAVPRAGSALLRGQAPQHPAAPLHAPQGPPRAPSGGAAGHCAREKLPRHRVIALHQHAHRLRVRARLQSRSNRCIALPYVSANTCSSMCRGRARYLHGASVPTRPCAAPPPPPPRAARTSLRARACLQKTPTPRAAQTRALTGTPPLRVPPACPARDSRSAHRHIACARAHDTALRTLPPPPIVALISTGYLHANCHPPQPPPRLLVAPAHPILSASLSRTLSSWLSPK